MHEVEEHIKQLRYEGLDLLQALGVISINEAAQGHHSINTDLQVMK